MKVDLDGLFKVTIQVGVICGAAIPSSSVLLNFGTKDRDRNRTRQAVSRPVCRALPLRPCLLQGEIQAFLGHPRISRKVVSCVEGIARPSEVLRKAVRALVKLFPYFAGGFCPCSLPHCPSIHVNRYSDGESSCHHPRDQCNAAVVEIFFLEAPPPEWGEEHNHLCHGQ